MMAAVGFGVALVVAGALGLLACRHPPRRLIRENHAGRQVAAILGLAFVPAVAAGLVATRAAGSLPAHGWVVLAAAGAVWLAGLADDLWAAGTRGLGGHLGSLARGRPTTGILKLAVAVMAAVWVAATVPGAGAVWTLSTLVLVATATNLGNALDVRPGRALKWAGLALAAAAAAALVVDDPTGSGPVAAAALGAVLGLLPLDLKERGMLGDAGSNPLGLLAGATLAGVLPPWGVVGAAAVALGLQLVAETVTVSRVIDAVPPLRWLDRLGRRS
jgi:hypothetical protein